MSADTKTSPVVYRRPKKYDAVKNAFGTSPGPAGSCGTWATEACWSVCYADKSRRYTAVAALQDNNTDHVADRATEDRWPELASEYADMLRESERLQRAKGVTAPIFRWKWSGETFNEWEARAIAEAHRMVPTIKGWIYTRNLLAVAYLTGVATLRVLVSADKDNIRAAESIATLYNLQVAYMDDGAERERTERALVCPAAKRGNVVKSSKSPSGLAGICSVCRACVDTKATPNIVFPIH